MKRFYSHMALFFIALFVVISNVEVCGKNVGLLDTKASQLYIIGQVEGQEWAADKGTPMTTSDGNIFTVKINFGSGAAATATFALATALGANADDWDTLNASRFGPATDGEVLGNNTSVAFQQIASTAFSIQKGEYNVTVNIQKKTILALSTNPLPPLPSVYPESVYLIGQIDGITEWKPNSGIKLDKDSEGVFVGIIPFKNNATWGIVEKLGATDTDWDGVNAKRYGPAVDSQFLADDVATLISKNTNAAKVSGGECIVVVDFTTMTVTCTLLDTPPVEYPEVLFVLGQIKQDPTLQWKTDDDSFPLVKTAVEGEYKGTGRLFGDEISDKVYFTITSKVGPTWDIVNPNRYGPTVADMLIVENVAAPMAKTDNSFSIAKSEKQFDVVVNLKNNTVVLSTVSGVSDIPANDGVTVIGLRGEIRIDGTSSNIEVFNTNGTLISKDQTSVQCTPGIYFVKAGAKVVKVAVR